MKFNECTSSQHNLLSNTNEDNHDICKIDYLYLERFVDTLLSGVNLHTGEVLSDDHLMKSNEIKQILRIVKKSIYNKNKPIPTNAGSKWTKKEDQQLRQEYLSRMTIEEICVQHQRSYNSIKSRLSKLFPEEMIRYNFYDESIML